MQQTETKDRFELSDSHKRRNERCVKTVAETTPKSLEEMLENHRNGTPTLRPGQFLRTNLND